MPEYAALRANLWQKGERLRNALQTGIRAKRDRLSLCFSDAVRLRVQRAIEQRRQRIDEAHAAIGLLCERTLEARRHRLEREKERLYAYAPQRTLERGFALIADGAGKLLTSVGQVRQDETVSIRFADGTAQARITGKETV